MNIECNKRYLVTTDNWFCAPDGKQYRCVFGTVKGCLNDEQALGIKTNRNSTNWFLSIGNMLIAGCQIHYAVQIELVSAGDFTETRINSNNIETATVTRPVEIYFADEEFTG